MHSPTRLADPVRVPCLRGRTFWVEIQPPGSKSLTNRALLLAALADGSSVLLGALVGADDTARMIDALRDLGAEIALDGPDTLTIRGVAGRWKHADLTLDLHNAGTATRFLAAAALLAPGPLTITGNERMRQRPIGELARLLTRLGAQAEHLGRADCPPLRITPPPSAGPAPRPLEIPTTVSSQFISALLLVAPWLPGGLTLKLTGEVTSPSYISMTLALLDHLGATVRMSEDLRILRVSSRAGLPAFRYAVEPDASSATYFWGAAALSEGSRCAILGLDPDSLQGDASFVDILHRVGAGVEHRSRSPDSPGWIACHGGSLAPINADLSSMPDAAMTLAAICAFAPGRSILRGLRTLRVKESDRIEALRAELARIHVKVESPEEGTITITPPPGGVDCSDRAPEVAFETYDDHRMAMSLALIGLRRPNVLIRDPGCVAKTYPGFWTDLARLSEAAR